MLILKKKYLKWILCIIVMSQDRKRNKEIKRIRTKKKLKKLIKPKRLKKLKIRMLLKQILRL